LILDANLGWWYIAQQLRMGIVKSTTHWLKQSKRHVVR
jgi:hypothetical protein